MAYAGAIISWDASLRNPTPYPQTFDSWIDFSGPMSGTFMKNLDRVIAPGESAQTVEVRIPDSVEEGFYTVKGRVGIYGDEIWDSEVFEIEIRRGSEQSKIPVPR
jgi:hypothetical protein